MEEWLDSPTATPAMSSPFEVDLDALDEFGNELIHSISSPSGRGSLVSELQGLSGSADISAVISHINNMHETMRRSELRVKQLESQMSAMVGVTQDMDNEMKQLRKELLATQNKTVGKVCARIVPTPRSKSRKPATADSSPNASPRPGQNETSPRSPGGRRQSMDAMGFGGMGGELDLSSPSSGNHTPGDSGQSWRDKMQAKAELKKRELESRHDEETAKARHDEIASISEKPIIVAPRHQLRADGPAALSSVTPLGATTDGSAAEEPLTEECSEWSSSAEDSDDEERTDRV